MTDGEGTDHVSAEKLFKQGMHLETFDLTKPLNFSLFKRAFLARSMEMKVAHIMDPNWVAKIAADFLTIEGPDPNPPGFTAPQWQTACRDSMRRAVERWPETLKKQEEEYGLLTAVSLRSCGIKAKPS